MIDDMILEDRQHPSAAVEGFLCFLFYGPSIAAIKELI